LHFSSCLSSSFFLPFCLRFVSSVSAERQSMRCSTEEEQDRASALMSSPGDFGTWLLQKDRRNPYAYTSCRCGLVRLATEHLLILQGCLDAQRRYAYGKDLSIANQQNCFEALLQELGLFSLRSPEHKKRAAGGLAASRLLCTA
jgi:hypothetical protein